MMFPVPRERRSPRNPVFTMCLRQVSTSLAGESAYSGHASEVFDPPSYLDLPASFPPASEPSFSQRGEGKEFALAKSLL